MIRKEVIQKANNWLNKVDDSLGSPYLFQGQNNRFKKTKKKKHCTSTWDDINPSFKLTGFQT